MDNQTLSIGKPATKPTISWQILTLRDGILTSHVLNPLKEFRETVVPTT
jgi:hypothetical protein